MRNTRWMQGAVWITGLVIIMATKTVASETREQRHARALSILRGALKTETGFKKVHAAEALIWSGYPQGVEVAFEEELRTESESIIGVWRTMAQLPGRDDENRAQYLRKIVALLPQAKDLELLRTLETLGKLHFVGSSPLIRRLASAKTGRETAMARWVLANSGEMRDELRLVGLLAVTDAATRGTAAYALRWMPTIRSGTLERLHACAEAENSSSPWQTFVRSALFVHAPQREVAAAKAQFLAWVDKTGENGDKYEAGQVLAIRGEESDYPRLEGWMTDPEIDVRVGAAYALIQIDRRGAAQHRVAKIGRKAGARTSPRTASRRLETPDATLIGTSS